MAKTKKPQSTVRQKSRIKPQKTKPVRTTKQVRTTKRVAPPDTRGRLAKLVETKRFAQVFVVSSLSVLAVTTVFWTVLAARLHDLNADQTVDAFMFESWQAFNGALFPGAHTFLLKWPLFAFMQYFGHGPSVFLVFTLLMVLVTVGALVYLLYRIDRRPYVFGLLCLALSSVLLLVPAQSYPGALLPVNMAMTTTRNLEYVLFIAAIILALRLKVLFSWAGLGAVLLLAVVIASDKLFAVLAAGGVLFAAAVHILKNRSNLNKKYIREGSGEVIAWAVLLVLGVAAATGILYALNALHITNIVDSDAASPYQFINSPKQLAIGLVFGGLAWLTNFGANPVHEITVLRELPGALLDSVMRPSILAFAANLLLLAAGMFMSLKVLIAKKPDDTWTRLAVILIGATLAAGTVYVLTDHYYPVDARYLTIGLFAMFIASAVYLRGRKVRPAAGVVVAAGLVLLLPLGLLTAMRTYQAGINALTPRAHLNERVTEEVDRRGVEQVVGNYWDVMPVKEAAKQKVTAAPLDRCELPRPVLNSGAWFNQPRDASTAYLAVRDGSLFAGPDYDQAGPEITYGGCSLEKVVGTYGVPDERVPIHSTAEIGDYPDVLLLLYPQGTKQAEEVEAATSEEIEQAAAEAAETPVQQSLPAMSYRAICSQGTVLQIVAHQDDDILFMNPDIQTDITAGKCIRTVYLTAGDAGAESNYWSGRELGAEAAYAHMYGVENVWERRTELLGGKQVTVSYLSGIPEISLVFMRLPDGNMQGQGFISRQNQSIKGLLDGTLMAVDTVDNLAAYSREELVNAIKEVITLDQPGLIRTQGSGNDYDGDHADHHAAGKLADEALAGLSSPFGAEHYLGYPTKEMPASMAEADITRKQEIFLAYAKHDGAVCQTVHECQQTVTYGNYLQRQYQRP